MRVHYLRYHRNGRRRQGNEPDYDLRFHLYQLAGVDLTAVDGMNVLLVQQILSEIGTDMSQWRTEKHFTSWLGLAPNNAYLWGQGSEHENQTHEKSSQYRFPHRRTVCASHGLCFGRLLSSYACQTWGSEGNYCYCSQDC